VPAAACAGVSQKLAPRSAMAVGPPSHSVTDRGPASASALAACGEQQRGGRAGAGKRAGRWQGGEVMTRAVGGPGARRPERAQREPERRNTAEKHVACARARARVPFRASVTAHAPQCPRRRSQR
jgi:hypothetical protein